MDLQELFRIRTNVGALRALNALNQVNARILVHQLRLSSGKRINIAADDAAGYTIARKFEARSRGLGAALDNIGSAKNLLSVGEGHLQNINDMLVRMKELATQAANDTLGDEERSAIMDELRKLAEQIDAEVDEALWAGRQVLTDSDIHFQVGAGVGTADELTFNVVSRSGVSVSGFKAADLNVTATATSSAEIGGIGTSMLSDFTVSSVGATAEFSHVDVLPSGYYTVEVEVDSSHVLTVRLRDGDGNLVTVDTDGNSSTNETGTALSTTLAGTATTATVNLGNGLYLQLSGLNTNDSGVFGVNYTLGNPVSSQSRAQAYMQNVDTAISNVSKALSYIGAVTNRLEYLEISLTVDRTNTEAARARIEDADMAKEQLELTKLQIIQQTAVAMLAQANTSPQAVLTLFR